MGIFPPNTTQTLKTVRPVTSLLAGSFIVLTFLVLWVWDADDMAHDPLGRRTLADICTGFGP